MTRGRFGFWFLSLVLVSCGGSSSSSSFQDTALSRIPKATSPVVSTASSSVLISAATAQTGLPLARAAQDDYGNSYSSFVEPASANTKIKNRGACEMHNFTGNTLSQAAEADFLLCLLGQLIPSGSVSSYADGQYHIVTINDSEGAESEVYKLRFRASLNANEQVTSFEMFTCLNGSQEGYVQQTIAEDGTLSMTSVGNATPDNAEVDSVQYQTTVSGTVNSSNAFTGTKTVNLRYENDFAEGQGYGANHVEATVTQSANNILYNGYSCEKTSINDTTCAQSSLLYAYAQLLNNNSSAADFNINLYALGHGAYVTSGGDAATGWDADNAAIADATSISETERQYVDDNKGDIATPTGTFTDIAFTEAQTWDCSGASEETFTLSDSNVCLGRFDVNQDLRMECNDITE